MNLMIKKSFLVRHAIILPCRLLTSLLFSAKLLTRWTFVTIRWKKTELLTKIAKTWKYMTGCLACVLVIPYCRSWSWCDPIFHAGMQVGKKHDGKTRQLLSLLDRFTGWETLGAFNRRVEHADIDVISVVVRVEGDGANQDEPQAGTSHRLIQLGRKGPEGSVGGNGISNGHSAKPSSN